MPVRRRRAISSPSHSPSVLRRVQQEATNKYNDLKDKHLSNLTNYRWMRYVIALWTFRMVFVAIGFLFPLLSLLSTTHTEPLFFDLQGTTWTASNNSFLRSLISNEVPFLFHHAPVPDSSIVGYLLLSYMPSTISNIKKSTSGRFVYHSSSQQWSSKTANTAAEYEILDMNKESFMNQLKPLFVDVDQQPQSYLYYSQLLRKPEANQILLNLAPYLLKLPTSTKGLKPEFRLWLSSENATATPHYDMEHNFFLQVNGTKTFLIGSPTLSKLFLPHSYLHPHWRQAQESHLTSVDSIYTHILNVSLASICSQEGNMSTNGIQKVTVTNKIKALQWGPTCSAPFTVSQQPKKKKRRKRVEAQLEDAESHSSSCDIDNSDSDSDAAHFDGYVKVSEEFYAASESHNPGPLAVSDLISTPSSLYEVTLTPGDLLYIPPFYYHAVISHAHSVSVNTWIGSRYLVASDTLQNIELPYRAKNTALAQVSALAAMIKMVMLNLNNPVDMEYFADLMRSRHSRTHFTKRDENNEEDTFNDSGMNDNKEEHILETKVAKAAAQVHVPACTLKSLKRAGELCSLDEACRNIYVQRQ